MHSIQVKKRINNIVNRKLLNKYNTKNLKIIHSILFSGWYYGERIRDGETGWFPGNHTTEIASQHVRARNLKQRYRLLALSGNYLQQQEQMRKQKS